MNQAPPSTDDRLTLLEETVAALRAEVDGYKAAFAAAAASPMVSRLLASMGIKLPKEPPT